MNATSTSALSFEQLPVLSAVHNQPYVKVIDKRSNIFYTDEAIVAGLKTSDMVIMKYIYKHFYRQIKFLVTSNSGMEMDAEDIFQDALLVIYQKISSNDLNLTSSFKTYLYAISRHLWLQRLNKREFNSEYKEIDVKYEQKDDFDMEEHLEESEKYKLFQLHFLKLSANDQKVLKLYMNKTSLKDIAQIMGYKSDKYAKHRKYICKEKLKNSIINDPQFQKFSQYEEFCPGLN